LIVVVPRLTCGLGGEVPIREVWGSTSIRLPADGTVSHWRCELGGQVVQARDGALAMADVTAVLPVAVLSPQR
jgi:Maltooligosyl trehalose synthase